MTCWVDHGVMRVSDELRLQKNREPTLSQLSIGVLPYAKFTSLYSCSPPSTLTYWSTSAAILIRIKKDGNDDTFVTANHTNSS